MPAQYTEHALTRTPFLLPAQSLQLLGACVSLKATGVFFAVIDAARMLLAAGPNTRDRTSSIAENRPNLLAIIKEGYQFPTSTARATQVPGKDAGKLRVNHFYKFDARAERSRRSGCPDANHN
jgi:hypothetical protein